MTAHYTREMAIEEMKKCYQENNDITSAIYSSQKRKPSASWIAKEFGSWTEAVRKANLSNKKIFTYGEEFLLEQIRKCAKENNGVIGYDLYKHSDFKPSVDYIVNFFGTWSEALKKAGIAEERAVHVWTDEAMLDALTECYLVYKKAPKRIYAQFAKEKKYPSQQRISERFGSWNKALEKAGIPINKKSELKYSKKDIVQAIKQCYEENNQSITTEIYEKWQAKKKENPVLPTITTHFDSWLEALKEAGIAYSKEKYSDQEMLDLFKGHFSKMKGEFSFLRYQALKLKPALPTLLDRFGSLENLYQILGLEEYQKRIYYDKASCLLSLKEFIEESDTYTQAEYRHQGRTPSLATIRKHCGSWEKAVREVCEEKNKRNVP